MTEILRVSRDILLKYPLCDRCLGRLFANLGRGLSNLERGRAIKLALSMAYHAEASRDPEKFKEDLHIMSRNAGEPFLNLYKYMYGGEPPNTVPCYVCGGRIESLISDWVRRAGEAIKALGARRFILGVKPPRAFVDAEEEIARIFSLQFWESVRSELKREIGKRVASTYSSAPDFDDPEVMLVLDLEKGSIEAIIPPLIIDVRFVKLARGISVRRRVGGRGSLEDIARRDVGDLVRDVRIMIPIRDTSRYRILGSCESIIVIRSPEPSKRDIGDIELALNREPSIYRVKILGRGSRRIAEELSTKIKRILYRAYIYLEKGISVEAMNNMAPGMEIAIEQKTPSRILRGGYGEAEKLTRGEMRIEGIHRISTRTLEILISLPPSIYIEEAITGDGGRTNPSISSLLGSGVTPLEIDVIGVEI